MFQRSAISMMVLSLCLVTSLSSCSKSGGRLSVGCKVELDGKPLNGGSIGFVGQNGATAATGVINSSGSYQLQEVQGAGIQPGKYTVKIESWTEQPGAELPKGGFSKGVSAIPEKYNSPQNSGLTAEVTPSNRSFDFSLTSK